MKMDEKAQKYIETLVSHGPNIESIWLFGSRANAAHKDTSDWDFLVFSDLQLLNRLRSELSFYVKGIDLLIVFNGKDFEGPWPDKGGI